MSSSLWLDNGIKHNTAVYMVDWLERCSAKRAGSSPVLNICCVTWALFITANRSVSLMFCRMDFWALEGGPFIKYSCIVFILRSYKVHECTRDHSTEEHRRRGGTCGFKDIYSRPLLCDRLQFTCVPLTNCLVNLITALYNACVFNWSYTEAY